MESGVCVDCITVEAVSDVLTLQFRQRKTTEERDGKRYGLSLWPQLGQINPAGPAQCLKVLGASDVIRKNFLEFREGGGESAWVHRSKKPKIGFCQQTG